MKVSYLHGLESPNHGPKVDWLNDKFSTYIPKIDYRNENAFEDALDGCRGSDLIIGSSMGGYFAYIIGQHLKIPTLLFNPAVVSREFDPVVELSNRNGTKNTVYLGKNDNVIKGSKIKKYFSNEGVGSFKYTIYDGEHRVPEDVFIGAVSETLKIKESRVHSFESFQNKPLNEVVRGWGDDPKKPKAIDKVENRVHKWINGLKRGWTQNTQYSPKLDRLRREWEDVIDKHKDEWEPKYNFGDLLA